MSTTTANDPVAEHPEHPDHPAIDEAHGPTDKIFVKTAVILAVITAVEVGWSYLQWDTTSSAMRVLEVGGLLAMMMWKFVVVAGTFMHLKYDKKLLTGLFYTGLVLAVFVYLVMLATFQVWGGPTPGFAP